MGSNPIGGTVLDLLASARADRARESAGFVPQLAAGAGAGAARAARRPKMANVARFALRYPR
jgi:hypothetical protein